MATRKAKSKRMRILKSTPTKVQNKSRNPVNVTLPGGRRVKAQSVVFSGNGAKVVVLDEHLKAKRRKKANPKKRVATKKRRATKRKQNAGGQYYSIVGFGSGPKPAKGPFKSITDANLAVERFKDRYSDKAGTYLQAGAVRLVGPFETRAQASRADVSRSKVVRQYNPGRRKH